MPHTAALLQQRVEIDAPLTHRSREIERGGRHRKSWRLKIEQAVYEIIRHLVISSPADAVNELVRQEESEKQGEREGAGRDAKLVLPTPLEQAIGRDPAINR